MTKPALWMGTALLLASCAASHLRPGADGGTDGDALPTVDVTDAWMRTDDAPTCAPEVCDGADQDCDGRVDEDALCVLPGAASACVEGACELRTCDDGFADCDGSLATGCEVAVGDDRDNCGACGFECGLTSRCDAGTCVRERILDVAPGGFISCALLESSRVLCWGSNEYGTLGPEYPVGVYPEPVEIHGLPSNLVALSDSLYAGGFALADDGTLWAWGNNQEGSLGLGYMSTREAPTPVLLPVPIVEIRQTGGSACARTSSGDLWCWGDHGGSTGMMGRPTPQPVGLPGPVVAYSGPFPAGWAVATDEGIFTFGVTAFGLRGSEPGTWEDTPVRPLVLDEEASAVACQAHCCTVVAGAVRCWGTDYHGALGDGPPSDPAWDPYAPTYHDPTPALVRANPIDIQAIGENYGDAGACTLYPDGEVWCWGGAAASGLGSDAVFPAVLAPAGTASGIYGGSIGCMRLSGDTQLRCWGTNAFGQLGNGLVGPPSLTPVAVVGFE